MEPTTLGILVYHKQSTSARLRFLLDTAQGVCFATTLPALAVLADDAVLQDKRGVVSDHPAMVLRELALKLGLAPDQLELVSGFRVFVDVPGGVVPVYLAQCKTIDPPFDAVEQAGARFIAITEARGRPPVELQLLQKAYEHVLG